MTMSSAEKSKRFEELATKYGGFKTRDRVQFRCQEVFKGIDLDGADVLEIGAGSGTFSGYAAINGARSVVAIEPATDGSAHGIRERLQT